MHDKYLIRGNMKKYFLEIEESFDRSIDLLEISIDYCANNIDKANEISKLLTILEFIMEEQLKLKSVIEKFELGQV